MLTDKITDNQALFLEAVITAIRHADSQAKLSYQRNLNQVVISISPSLDEFKQDIINNLVYIHRIYHSKVVFSKSLAKSKTITFSLDLVS